MTNFPSIFDSTFLNNFTKNAVGFDDVVKRLNDFAEACPKVAAYPFYNIKKIAENTYVIELAVAGFGKQDIELTLEDNVLTIKGAITSDESSEYLFKGIADRAFTRKFTLADTVEVKNADLVNGMLKVFLERFIPESKKPKKININDNNTSDLAVEAEEAKKTFLAESKIS
jgi:molecular chaperone IbpA